MYSSIVQFCSVQWRRCEWALKRAVGVICIMCAYMTEGNSPVNVVSSDIRVMQIFAGVCEIWGVKQFVSSYYIRSMISLHNAVARLP